MKKKTALLAIALFAGSASLSMADPFFSANLRLAPGVHVAIGNRPVVVEPAGCSPAPVGFRPIVERRVVVASRWDRFRHHRRDRRYDRDDFRSYGDHDRRD